MQGTVYKLSARPAVQSYDILWECFLTGQMSEGELQGHLREDNAFRIFVKRHIAKRELRAANVALAAISPEGKR